MSVLVLSESENEGEQLLDELEDEVVAIAPRAADERANVPVSVVTERFLRAILDKVPLDRIEELHLFSPLRQGTVETGIAVVAARVTLPDEIEELVPLELDLAADATPEQVDESTMEALNEAADVAEMLDDEREPDLENSVEIERDETDETSDEIESDEYLSDDDDVDAHVLVDDSPYADEPVQLKLVPASTYTDHEDRGEVPEVAPREDERIAEEPEAPRVRHTVYTARYRLIVKGPERGKWEMDVVDEADAPLLAVETVVRGVQRRAGEETATVRYDASQLARVLRLPTPS